MAGGRVAAAFHLAGSLVAWVAGWLADWLAGLLTGWLAG